MPESLDACCIPTLHLPAISTLQNNQFVSAPDVTLPDDKNAARIFDVLEIIGRGPVPMSPECPEFGQQRYWRLVLPPDAILAGLIAQTGTGINGYNEAKETRFAQQICHLLNLGLLKEGSSET